MKMVSMKMPKAERKEAAECCPSDAPEYPYGLRLCLQKEQLEALGIAMPAIGEQVMLHAVAKAVGMNASAGEHGEYQSLDLQITDLAVMDEKMDMAKAANALYGKDGE